MTEQKRSNLPWILAGCGALFVFGCCVSSAAGLFLYRTTASREQTLVGLAEQQAREGADEAAAQQADAQRRLAEQGLGPQLPPSGDTPTLTIMATVTRVSGSRMTVRAGETCIFPITYPTRGDDPTQRWCNAPVRCGGVLIYGGGTGGFFPCMFSQSPASVVGSDSETTNGDRDGAFSIDTNAGTIRVRDDSGGDYGTFELDATITRAM